MKVTRQSSTEEYARALAEAQGLPVDDAIRLALRHACRLEGVLDEPEVMYARLTAKGHEEAELLRNKPS